MSAHVVACALSIPADLDRAPSTSLANVPIYGINWFGACFVNEPAVLNGLKVFRRVRCNDYR